MSAPRRVVTGHDDDGRSVVLADGPAPKSHSIPGATFHEVWNTTEMPVRVSPWEEREPTERALRTPPDPGGTIVRIVDLEPGSRSPMHRTETVDYGIVLAGHVLLALDDGSETELGAGDVVVQRGTDHAWVNSSDEPARMAFVLVDGRFTDELRTLLGADVQLFGHPVDE
ncbi:MAG TPA: cupin domain-containing protein [Gaiella sp.]|nr:cupin domain-containing protein [Gaiella sp.]